MTYLNREGVNWASGRTTGNPLDKAVLVFIGGRANKHWAAFPGKAEIARVTEIAESTVVKCIRRLEQGGHLVRVPFAATNGADQKIGYVLAGCGRPLNELDDDFLALAFADRKQPGVPRAVKPQHWSGERKEGRVPHSHPPRVPHSHPEGRSTATPRSKEHTEDRKEQEETFGRDTAAAPSPQQDQKHTAVAEVSAEAPTRNRNHQIAAARIPTQRQRQDRRSVIQQRDDNWRAQIAAADYDELCDAASEARPGIHSWAFDLAAYRLGISAYEPTPPELDDPFMRTAYLLLLKKSTADGDEDVLDLLLEPLDDTIVAGPRGHQWDECCYTPAGESADSFVERMKQAARSMTWRAVGPWTAEIEASKPGVWGDCWEEARRNLRAGKLPVTIASLGETAVELAIEHYKDKGKWPVAFVPPSLRSAFPAQSAPPAWMAA